MFPCNNNNNNNTDDNDDDDTDNNDKMPPPPPPQQQQQGPRTTTQKKLRDKDAWPSTMRVRKVQARQRTGRETRFAGGYIYCCMDCVCVCVCRDVWLFDRGRTHITQTLVDTDTRFVTSGKASHKMPYTTTTMTTTTTTLTTTTRRHHHHHQQQQQQQGPRTTTAKNLRDNDAWPLIMCVRKSPRVFKHGNGGGGVVNTCWGIVAWIVCVCVCVCV